MGTGVLVDVTAIRTDGRAEGRIVRSLSRAHPTVVGIFHYGHRPQLRQTHRPKSNAGNRHPARMEMPQISRSPMPPVVKISPTESPTPQTKEIPRPSHR